MLIRRRLPDGRYITVVRKEKEHDELSFLLEKKFKEENVKEEFDRLFKPRND